MSKKILVIVESPGKVRTISKYLGSNYIVCSSKGHIRDLPSKPTKSPSGRKKKITPPREFEKEILAMGVDPDQDWKHSYQILPGKDQVVKEICKLRTQCDRVYLATDLDREGEAIAWHLKEILQGEETDFKRVIFNEITESAIRKAFENPGNIDYNKVYAQQARRFLDRVVGFMVSPLLWSKIARGLSAGRVQSVAVRLVVEREREIRAFVPTPFWEVSVDLKIRDKDISVDLVKQHGKPIEILSEQQVLQIEKELTQGKFLISSILEKETKSSPGPPFITSTLQQMASSFLGFSSKKTMLVAQKLYEKGKITYMRTDSTSVSKEALGTCRNYIQKNIGSNYLPSDPRFYQRKKGTAQEAHEAIRPSNIFETDVSGDKDESRLYQLIWKRFVASQMSDAIFKVRSIFIQNISLELLSSSREVVFPGFTKVWSQEERKSSNNQNTLDFQKGDLAKLKKIHSKKQFTRPKPRYTEATLTKELEKRNIGRPSTYVPILSTIQERGYATLRNRRFYANQMGNIVTSKLLDSFKDLLNYDFTANMEEQLDLVASGVLGWKDLLNQFYKKLVQDLRLAKEHMIKSAPIPVDVLCSFCSVGMEVRIISSGLFLSCSNYADKACKATKSLIPWEEVSPEISLKDENAQEDRDAQLLTQKPRCLKCNLVVDEYFLDKNTKLFVCQDITDCGAVRLEKGTYEVSSSEGKTIDCDRCGQKMNLKVGRFGKYFSCSQEICKNTRKVDSKGKVCPPKMIPIPCPEIPCEKVKDTYVLRDGASGLFLAASGFPKNREVRQPFLDEILPYKAQIDKKYHYLFTAPIVDSVGRRTRLKFSKAKQIHHLISEENGKPSNWKCEYDLNQKIWVESLSGKK